MTAAQRMACKEEMIAARQAEDLAHNTQDPSDREYAAQIAKMRYGRAHKIKNGLPLRRSFASSADIGSAYRMRK